MKVLHVIASVSPSQGGPSRAIVDMERALAGRGIEVTTIATNDDGKARFLDAPCGVPVPCGPATRWYFPRATNFYKYAPQMGRWLKRHAGDFDLVHAHALFAYPPLAGASAARRAGVPYILRPLGVLAPYGMTKRRPLLKKMSLALVEKPLIEAAGAMHFTSEQERREAEALGLRCRSAVIPLGIAMGADGPAARNDGELLCVMRLDPKKNIEGILRALVLLKGKALRLRIAGDGDADYVRSLKSLAAELDVSGQVEWLGYLAGEEKAAAFLRASVFLLPSYSENFGIGVAEALGHGLPCIISRETGIQETIMRAGAGVLVDTSPQSIAEAIRTFLEMPREAQQQMGQAARRLAREEFSLEMMGERLETLYRQVIAAAAPVRAGAGHRQVA